MKYLWVIIAAWLASMMFDFKDVDMDFDHEHDKEYYDVVRDRDDYRPQRRDYDTRELYARSRGANGRYR